MAANDDEEFINNVEGIFRSAYETEKLFVTTL